MSLDVTLIAKVAHKCPTCGVEHEGTFNVFEANITHNLNKMADAAGIYLELWRPDEIGVTAARELIEPLRRGIAAMKAEPEHFRSLEPENRWGTYETFIPWLERYLKACEDYPTATIEADR